MKLKNCFTYFAFLALLTSFAFAETPKRNVVFILSDDHRFDFMGFTGKLPWLKTPHMDNMAEQGVYFDQAYVTTSLCSPSRASILTGLYAHTHTIVDDESMLALENSPRGERRASTDAALAERPCKKTNVNYKGQVANHSIDEEAEGSRPVRQRIAAITLVDGQDIPTTPNEEQDEVRSSLQDPIIYESYTEFNDE